MTGDNISDEEIKILTRRIGELEANIPFVGSDSIIEAAKGIASSVTELVDRVLGPFADYQEESLKSGIDFVSDKINRPEDMTGIYEGFARDTYTTVRNRLDIAGEKSGDLPVLVVSGERHFEENLHKFASNLIPDKYEEPPLAATYTHIASIQAAVDIAGRENVVVSVELSDRELERIEQEIEYKIDVRNDILEMLGAPEPSQRIFLDSVTEWPIYEAVRFAVENGLEIVATDKLKGISLDQEHFDAEIEELGKIALNTSDPPRFVVHIGGAAHIGTLQGHSIDALARNGSELTREDALSPFNGIYGEQVYINTAQNTLVDEMELAIREIFGDHQYCEYSMKKENAIQIDPPGHITEDDVRLAPERIIKISEQYDANRQPADQTPSNVNYETDSPRI